jgi:hypothetical protein
MAPSRERARAPPGGFGGEPVEPGAGAFVGIKLRSADIDTSADMM